MCFVGGGNIRREKRRPNMILRCRLCHASIAAFEPTDVIPPLSGAMFGPLEPGFPLPFDPAAPWAAARCLFCRHHPQGYDPTGQDQLDTADGEYIFGFEKRVTGKTRQMKRGE
jgi:hypothetical protein